MPKQNRPQNPFLVGKIAVRLVIVDGPAGTTEKFSDAEIARIEASTLTAIRLLTRQATGQPTRVPLKWALWVSVVPVSTPALPFNANPQPPSDTNPMEPLEAPWRDAALQTLVGQTGEAGLQALRAASIGGADSALLFFVTRYEAGWFAYASDRLARVVLCWPMFAAGRPGADPVRFAASVAHEMCHLFGAPDEYAASHCSALDANGQGFGELDVSNFNCENINAQAVRCLMASNDIVLCDTSTAHVGWTDSDRNGVLDVFE